MGEGADNRFRKIASQSNPLTFPRLVWMFVVMVLQKMWCSIINGEARMNIRRQFLAVSYGLLALLPLWQPLASAQESPIPQRPPAGKS